MSIFSTVDTGIKAYRSGFKPNYRKIMTANFGKLYPVLNRVAIPGDVWRVGGALKLMCLTPLQAPELTDCRVNVHYFFVPYRLATEDFGVDVESVFTGGEDGTYSNTLPTLSDPALFAKGTLCDYFGYPILNDKTAVKFQPNWMNHFAYNTIYNEYFRHETLQDEVAYDNNTLLNTTYMKDYFTACLPEQQKGEPLAFPLSGFGTITRQSTTSLIPSNTLYASTTAQVDASFRAGEGMGYLAGVDFSQAGSFDVADVRYQFALQRIYERANRCGSRYTEFLRSTFGVSPNDDRLQRPEFLGGFHVNLVSNTIVQNSESGTTPQGTLTANFVGLGGNTLKPYHVKEFGVIMGIMSIVPRPSYCQGLNRQHTYKGRFDFFNPSFQNLSEQEVFNGELYSDGTDDDNKVFGFIGRYDELRTNQDEFSGDMRDTFDYWHLGRKFANRPELDSDFLTVDSNDTKRIFAVQNVDPFAIDFYNELSILRPMVTYPVPGLIDHN